MKQLAAYRRVFAVITATAFVTSSPLHASPADDAIVTEFTNSFLYRTCLKDDAIKTEVKDGVITLTGTVADESHSKLAQQTAWCLLGVTLVDNKLLTNVDAATEKADALIGRQVKLALSFHRNVSADKTTVEVKDGYVTLKGNASSMAQMELTAEYAKDIAGVKDVKNKMTVDRTPLPAERTAEEILDDASVSAQVKMAMMTHLSTCAIPIKVVTRNGHVAVTGIVRNEAEKSLVTKVISDIRGVTSVNNQMTVAPVVTQ